MRLGRAQTARLALAASLAAGAAAAISAAPADDRPPELFDDASTLSLQLDAPLQKLFDSAKEDPDASVAGRLVYSDAEGRSVALDGVDVSVRGNTSRREDECMFPKLKLRLKDAAHRGEAGLFGHLDTLKIGTHCGESDGETLTKKYGRLANERAAHREAFVYRLLGIMDVPTLLTRPARITYVDGNRRLERDAFLLEDLDEAVKRFGGDRSLDEKNFTTAREQFSATDAATTAFAEAMIGNFDWCLKFYRDDRYRCDSRHPLWNLAAPIGGRLDHAIPLMHDFDLAGMVTGRHTWFNDVFDGGLDPSMPAPAVEVTAQVQRARSLFTRAELDAVRRRFLSHRDRAFAALDAADVDPAGRDHIRAYLTAFFDAIGDRMFYRPVVIRKGVKMFRDAGGRQPACGPRSGVPAGTPVSGPLATEGSLTKVRVLDVFWRWTTPDKCSAVRGPVWIDPRAVGTDYPAARD